MSGVFSSLRQQTTSALERPSVAAAVGFVFLLIIASILSTVRQYRRLAHFKGPLQASLSKWWLIKTVGGGRAYLDFWEVTQRYGKPLRSSSGDSAAWHVRCGWHDCSRGIWHFVCCVTLLVVRERRALPGEEPTAFVTRVLSSHKHIPDSFSYFSHSGLIIEGDDEKSIACHISQASLCEARINTCILQAPLLALDQMIWSRATPIS